jgi:hypothetical protein
MNSLLAVAVSPTMLVSPASAAGQTGLVRPGLGLCVAAAVGTTSGALVGTIFGAAIPRWKRRYP